MIRISHQPHDSQEALRRLDREAIGEWERDYASSKAGDFPEYQHYTICWMCNDAVLGCGDKDGCWEGEGENTLMGRGVRVCDDCWRKIKRENMNALPPRLFRKPKRRRASLGLTT